MGLGMNGIERLFPVAQEVVDSGETDLDAQLRLRSCEDCACPSDRGNGEINQAFVDRGTLRLMGRSAVGTFLTGEGEQAVVHVINLAPAA